LGDEQLSKRLWGTIEGLRKCYSSLLEFARAWVGSRLVFRNWELQNGYQMWTMLCQESEVVEKLVALQLRVIDGVIYVAEDFQADLSVVDQILDLMAILFRWKKWTDSRWMSMGDTSRGLLGSLILGIEALVSHAVDHGHSTYYLASARAMNAELKRFTVKCSVTSFVADAVLGKLLTDDRLPVMYEAIMLEIESEVEFILNIPADIWNLFGQVAGVCGDSLRSDSVRGAFTTSACLRALFEPVLQLPWSLCGSDDMRSALGEFLAEHEPTEAVAWSIWHLCRCG
jgi:hypothetical protein